MHLLPSSPLSIPQFASLSYLLMDVAADGMSSSGCSRAEPMILCSSLASVTHWAATAALEELHAYLSIVVLRATDAAAMSKESLADRFVLQMIREDERLLDEVQIFRPSSCDGLAIHYKLIRDDAEVILALASHISAAVKAGNQSATNGGNTSSSNSIPPGCVGIVLCVGMSGLPHSTGSSSLLQYSLPQRIEDCTTILTKLRDSQLVRTVLSSFLLADDEQRKSNEMSGAPNAVAFVTADETDKSRSLLSPMGMISPLGQAISPFAGNVASGVSTVASGVATGVSTVASGVTTVASGVVNFSKRMSMTGSIGAAGGRNVNSAVVSAGGSMVGGAGMNGGIDDASPAMKRITAIELRPDSAEAAFVMTERMNVLSVAESDTFLRKFVVTGHERKANLDLTGTGKSRFRRRKSDARDPDLDGFDYKGPAKESTRKKSTVSEPLEMFSSTASVSGSVATGISANSSKQPSLRHPKNDSKPKAATVPTLSAPGKDSITSRRASAYHISDDQSQASGQKSSARRRNTSSGPSFEDEMSLASEGRSLTSDGRSAANDSMSSSGRVQVNIALNEDLSCSYKLSQLSTCTVEGVVQIQVKTTGRSPNPFYLVLKDPAGHVDSLQENKKFADDLTASSGPPDGNTIHKFAVSIPKGENYFPVLRYKCSGDLRPVPIRVQTRVKVEGGYCRVALQISSNPNNEANLTDLTIIMGVPEELIGETLITQPAGGVWNEAKRSVIWCVSELGSGEKFQLQARFEADSPIDPEDEKPKFPVLVRCQCLFAQLSGVELDVKDISDRYPADLTMKLARRFRLSHRERS